MVSFIVEFFTELALLLLFGIVIPVFGYGTCVYWIAKWFKADANNYVKAIRVLFYASVITIILASIVEIQFTPLLAATTTVVLLTILSFVFFKVTYRENLLKTTGVTAAVLVLSFLITFRGFIALYFG